MHWFENAIEGYPNWGDIAVALKHFDVDRKKAPYMLYSAATPNQLDGAPILYERKWVQTGVFNGRDGLLSEMSPLEMPLDEMVPHVRGASGGNCTYFEAYVFCRVQYGVAYCKGMVLCVQACDQAKENCWHAASW
ncbi:hypothetical protein Nepgr_002832 [Nepenthes gracilis]|uniref:Uncharacterized protein n=1 Tax=Nepenthes gracilis TaxID=150966 RepID=A0AAD3RYH2_NEPGR|nr:hypothetical protein Nepgr_002832 [Nepenthes gracilis]